MTVAITAEGDTEIEYDAFDGHNEKFLLICDEKNTAAQAFALDNEMQLVTVSYDEEKKVINFKGTLTVLTASPEDTSPTTHRDTPTPCISTSTF